MTPSSTGKATPRTQNNRTSLFLDPIHAQCYSLITTVVSCSEYETPCTSCLADKRRNRRTPTCRYLEELQLDPTFYSLRWITTLLSREFALPDTLRLWDSLFAAPLQDRTRWVEYFCVTMCISIRDRCATDPDRATPRIQSSHGPYNGSNNGSSHTRHS